MLSLVCLRLLRAPPTPPAAPGCDDETGRDEGTDGTGPAAATDETDRANEPDGTGRVGGAGAEAPRRTGSVPAAATAAGTVARRRVGVAAGAVSSVAAARRRASREYDARVVELLAAVSLPDVYFWILTRRSGRVRQVRVLGGRVEAWLAVPCQSDRSHSPL